MRRWWQKTDVLWVSVIIGIVLAQWGMGDFAWWRLALWVVGTCMWAFPLGVLRYRALDWERMQRIFEDMSKKAERTPQRMGNITYL